MASDPRLEKLRDMDPVIGTFTAKDMVADPGNVNQRYLEHAATHMSLGDTSSYVDTLIRWTLRNRGAVLGAISGEYGYGKTSMAIYLWQQCELAGIVAVPPFEWHRLQDLIDATYAWTRYKLAKIKPGTASELDRCYNRFREKTIQEFSDEQGVQLSKVRELEARRAININCHSADVVDFLAEVNTLISNNDLHLAGPIVFTDELQVTMSRYLAEHRSRDEFMQDLFELLNPLVNRQGSFGLIIGLPLNTETMINDARPDILQRLQTCNLFIRPSSMYKRDFPTEVWHKFAEVYEFADIRDRVLAPDTLDSLGQIAFRNDLGAGPRTVIEAMRRAIDHFDETGRPFSPLDLVDAYLERQIAFDSGGKLVSAVTEVMQSKTLREITEGDRVIKLMAAFPLGCPDSAFRALGLEDARDEVSKRLYTDYLAKFPEGISLRKLAITERRAEPRFIELTKEFIRTYSESDRELSAALITFQEVVIQEELIKSRRADQIIGWIADARVANEYIGTFDEKYPERKLLVKVVGDKATLRQDAEEFAIGFFFDSGCNYETGARIECINDTGTAVVFCLNHLSRSSKQLNIPFIEDLGYPVRKVTPAFMLALVHHLRTNDHLIPEDEKRMQVPPFVKSLLNYSIQLLFGEDLHQSAPFGELSKVGLSVIEEIFGQMCRGRYGRYETLITTGRWERALTTYLGALNSKAVSASLGIVRGNKALELSEKEALALFGENRKQTLYGLAENLSGVLELKQGDRDKQFLSLRFKQHPGEVEFMQMLRQCEEKVSRNQLKLRVMGKIEGLALLSGLGYRDAEVGFILQMLKIRRLITYEEKQQCFIEVLESPAERQEAILAALTDARQRAAILTKLPDFDMDQFTTKADKIKAQVTACGEAEKLEEYHARVNELRGGLTQFVQTWERKIQGDFESVHQDVGAVVRQSVPGDLSRPLKSDVNWVSELVLCQTLLKDKYQRATSAFKDVDAKATTAWNTWKAAGLGDAEAFVVLYEANRAIQGDLKDAQRELEAAVAYLKSYMAWSNVLNAASRAYHEATDCEVSYREDQFKLELDKIFADIADRFQKKRLEALPNHEMYTEQVRGVQTRIDSWLRDRRDSFMELKKSFEDALRTLGVERANLRAVFDAFDPQTSRTNLISEVQERIAQHAQTLDQELGRYRTDVLYVERVLGADVSELLQFTNQARGELITAKLQLTEDVVRDQDRFGRLIQGLMQVSRAVRDIEQRLRGVMQKREPSGQEALVLDALNDPRGTDLSSVIAAQLASGDSAFSLEQLMDLVTSLFRKHQIIVRLERRR